MPFSLCLGLGGNFPIIRLPIYVGRPANYIIGFARHLHRSGVGAVQ